MSLKKWRGGYIRGGVYYIDLGDHRHRFSTQRRTPAEAMEALREFYRGEGAYLLGNRPQVDLSKTVEEYLKHSVSKNTVKHAEEQARGFERWAEFFLGRGVTHLEQVTAEACLEYQQYRLSGGASKATKYHKKPKTQLSPASYNRDLAYLTALITWARDAGKVPEDFDPLRRIHQLPEHRGVRAHREVPQSELTAVRAKLITKWADVLSVLYGTALRYDSLRRLTLGDIDVRTRVLRDPYPKGRVAVEVAVSKSVMAAAIRCVGYELPDDHAGQLDRRLSVACRLAGVPRFTPHDLRVSAASHLHRTGTPLRDLQRLLGHASITTTERYVRAESKPTQGPVLRAARRKSVAKSVCLPKSLADTQT